MKNCLWGCWAMAFRNSLAFWMCHLHLWGLLQRLLIVAKDWNWQDDCFCMNRVVGIFIGNREPRRSLTVLESHVGKLRLLPTNFGYHFWSIMWVKRVWISRRARKCWSWGGEVIFLIAVKKSIVQLPSFCWNVTRETINGLVWFITEIWRSVL